MDVEYARVSGTPFIAPNFPTAFTFPPLAITVEAVHLQDQHVDSICLYRECKHVEKALLQHI